MITATSTGRKFATQLTDGWGHYIFADVPDEGDGDLYQRPGELIAEGYAACMNITAQKLLAEAGYPGGAGFPQLRFITNDTPAHLAAAEKVREQLAENLGIDMAISGLSTQDFLAARGEDGWDMARGGFVGDRLDAAPYLEGWSAGAGANYGGFSSEEYDKLIAYARTAPEEKEEDEGDEHDDHKVVSLKGERQYGIITRRHNG